VLQNGSGCGFVQWHDPPLPEFLSELLGDLRDEVWRLRGEENGRPRSEVQAGRGALLQEEKNKLEAQLKEKTVELDVMKRKLNNLVLVFVVFVIGLVGGKLLFQ
jgi:hypothetical protein